MFFANDRKYFFRPLNSKYREQAVECLRQLYACFYSSMADYSRTYNREQVIEVFQEAITRTPLLDGDTDDEFAMPARGERDLANWVLNLLIEYGWLERLADEATLQSTYAFTRFGRLFTQPMVEAAGGRFRTRHRNTRNTRNALQSFVEQGEVYDLLDAFEYSERIISDFSDVIAELDERKRALVQAVEAQQVVQRASDEFFDFMEKRFMPDLSIRLSADSVEKYRDEIQALLNKARRKQKEFKAGAERELRKIAPELQGDDSRQSLYLMILNGIESRMHNASEVMLPALRHALNSFTRRADIIIRQLSYSGAGHPSRLLAICQEVAAQDESGQAARLAAAGRVMAALNVAVADPDSLRLNAARSRREVNTAVEEHGEIDKAARRALLIQQALELAFSVNNKEMRDYVVAALNKGHRIRSQHLPVENAKGLLMNAHAIEVGSAGQNSSEFAFRVEPTGQRLPTDYFVLTDEFIIELIETDRHAE
ncbi:MAG: flagellar protein FliT [Gammaproteobacteria bacterium]|jgi:predicted CopG family antitoxin|nr:flagellar protein FliT [Gammaproteobacteria bacterium]